MVEQIKELRVQIDGLAQLTKELKPIPVYNKKLEPTVYGSNNKRAIEKYKSSNEIEKSYDSLILAKAWLGKVLAELGTESPYKSGYKTKEDIEPTADVSLPIELKVQINETKPIGVSTRDMNHIEKVDWLRTEIEKLIKEVSIIGNAPQPPLLNREMSIARTNCYNHLCEAKFHLGFELQRIKESN